jgi:hypothetical protein
MNFTPLDSSRQRASFQMKIFAKFAKKYCSAPIQNSISRLPSRPWFVYQKWNPVGHGQEVTEGMVGKKKRALLSTLTGGKTCFVRAECFV